MERKDNASFLKNLYISKSSSSNNKKPSDMEYQKAFLVVNTAYLSR